MNKKIKKLVLFDIDGTILLSGKGAIRALKQAVGQHAGRAPDLTYKDTAGKTDRLIIRNILLRLSVSEDSIQAMTDGIISAYLELLPDFYNSDNDAFLLPGARMLIENLHNRGDAALGLITGNIEEGARIKLKPFGLNKYFLFGAYGSDAFYREQLPQIAVEHAERIHRRTFKDDDIVIIGDTVHDVTCGKSLNARSIAVIRREEYRKEIESEKPYYICAGLENYNNIVEKIFY